jgi:hypothetical protein
MSEREMAEGAKKKNILDMALTFTAMMRNFRAGSKKRIAGKLGETTLRLHEVTSAEDYERLHKEFCEWFCREIRTAAKTNRNTGTVTKPSQPASFGQARKGAGHCTQSVRLLLRSAVPGRGYSNPSVSSRGRRRADHGSSKTQIP